MVIMEEAKSWRVLVVPSADNSLEAAEVVRRTFEQIRLVRDLDISSTVQRGVRKEGQAGDLREEETEVVDSTTRPVHALLVLKSKNPFNQSDQSRDQDAEHSREISRQPNSVTIDSADPVSWFEGVTQLLDEILCLKDEAEALRSALQRTTDPIEFIGSDLKPISQGGQTPTDIFCDEVLRQYSRFLEAANSAKRASISDDTTLAKPLSGRRPLSLVEKILAHHAVGLEKPEVRPGDMICVSVDWTLTSELLWAGMDKTYTAMNRPRLHRNDRVWLAVDHTVDPRTNHQSRQRELIEKAERFRDEAKLVDFLPANTSIMHTDFTRDRAQPGYLVIGSDSHTCSAGSMGAFAVGFGAADVVMPLVTGETWFRVPEVCRINFVGKLPYGISGKDVILHIIGHFKRNTIAFQRAVEYGGPGLSELSMDARFAIANMTTEFGGMGACFESDQRTATWLAGRRLSRDKNRALYFKPDSEAQYADVRTIDLSKVRVTMAVYPDPDNVVEIHEKQGMKLDGCFIGACTTTEEELVLAGMVLEVGLASGLKPIKQGKRRVTPGSLIITRKLEQLGLLEVYRQAGFEIGAPGCSYCVGINDVDVAQSGEIWLSSQNRNFRNRMGPGSIGNVTSAAAVAASSFGMEVKDPRPLLARIDPTKYERLLGQAPVAAELSPAFQEPVIRCQTKSMSDFTQETPKGVGLHGGTGVITARIQRFGDNVDTDAIIPAQFMPGIDDADLGSHCFEHVRPEFRQRAANGATIIVAEHGFGSGSSREDAVRALKGAGVKMIVAKSFAFIYERNQLNMGVFNARISEDDFYQNAVEGAELSVDKTAKTLRVKGVDKYWKYEHSPIETQLLEAGGVLSLYHLYGNSLFREMTRPRQGRESYNPRIQDFTSATLTQKQQTALAW
ncbi:hypothetical protein PV10_05205 [Exophiala mesophila]|uniref:Aconitase/3-isopropylmalate dehydratase large subunit alpha/beta/alpha domain-containing protein n=1 Tax=Exophiala mesophila TaxID=212818 RepID=A0A0D2A4Z4_EXOME|nr:uncharacterized protein PV10_05205 [Exophiala mesophila]KIV94048.1 hypothetical protein PV10_05205 [Exophiala mesophila]